MKKKLTKRLNLSLIVIAIPVIVYVSFIIILHYNDAVKNSFPFEIHDTFNDQIREIPSVFYHLTTDDRYHYEFRYDFNSSRKNQNHRVMIILNDTSHSCSDMWDFSTGIHVLNALYDYGYIPLVICSQNRMFDLDMPIEKNNDAKYMYLSLQKWINEVYYEQFKRYPLLYIHATSRGAQFAGILCRILPIQAQALFIYPDHPNAMLTSSTHDTDFQIRLSLDPTFANWFYFDFCYNKISEDSPDRKLCPFQSNQNYYHPLPPTFFTYFPKQNFSTSFLGEISNQSLQLGGPLLNHSKTLQLDILHITELTPSFMQENFHIWRSKPYAAELFFEHLTNPRKYGTTDPQRKTCWCLDIDFKYFENYPNITSGWIRKKRYEYTDYVKDIQTNFAGLNEIVCGTFLETHAIVSRNINKSLDWMNEIDEIRHSFYVNDYLKRPLRIWMYDKKLLIDSSFQFLVQGPDWTNVSKEYLMYSPEYLLQDYFQRLSIPGEIPDQQRIQWAVNPLLADYFIIPSDFMYLYFSWRPGHLSVEQFAQLLLELSKNYFNSLMTSIRTKYPYWTLAASADEMGSNHILPIPGGRNMGIISEEFHYTIRNVIQIGFTGIENDDLPYFESRFQFRNLHLVYRHHYDVIIPQFTPLNINRTKSDNIYELVEKKNRLFYFAGNLSHKTTNDAARSQLYFLMEVMNIKGTSNRTMKIRNKEYLALTIINGHIETSEYIKSMQSSVFALCPEGFLPWSPRLYESIQLGSIPVILADNFVLPFARFIDWRSLSVKVNVSSVVDITSIVHRFWNLKKYMKRKLKNALPYLYAFRWPYSIVTDEESGKRIFKPQNYTDERGQNVFYYLSLELRCRRLEQLYGLVVNTTIEKSLEAKRLACTNHPTICPCHDESHSIAYQEYF